jgi:uncharacterized membrane protein
MTKLTNIITIAFLLTATCDGFTNVHSFHHPVTTTQPRQALSPSKIGFASLPSSTVVGSRTYLRDTNKFNWKQHASFTSNHESYDGNDGIIEADILDKKTSKTTESKVRKNKHMKNVQGLHPLIINSWNKVRKTLKKPTHKAVSLVAAAFIMLAVVFTPLSEAFAAPSGGRMGGSFGGSSRQSYSRSYSSPSPSRSYNRGFSQGYSSGYYSRPSVIVAPTISSPYPYYSPGGVAVVRRGPTIVDFFIYCVFAVVMLNVLTNVSNFTNDLSSTTSALGPGVSVAQISVALNVPQKDSPSSILTFLNRLSRTARTDSRVGVSNLVSQVALELLRQRSSVFAASSKSKHYNNGDTAQRDFSSLAIKERSKFDREGISNYGGVDYVGEDYRLGSGSYSPQATAAVVTIILAIDGDSTKLPTINSVADLEQALTRIATDAKVDDCLRSAEVLWTPEDSRDTLSQTDVIADYPELRTI